jgi:hypothetical protein
VATGQEEYQDKKILECTTVNTPDRMGAFCQEQKRHILSGLCIESLPFCLLKNLTRQASIQRETSSGVAEKN